MLRGHPTRRSLRRRSECFRPTRADEIDVETKDSAGINYVVDMLLAWRNTAKHNPNLPRVAGLVDQDEEAKKAASEWNKISDNLKSAKCFKLPTPPHLFPVLRAEFRVPIVLETIYSREAWEWADGRGYLTNRSFHKVLKPDLNNSIVAQETTLDQHLEDEWAIFVKKEFVQAGKGRMAQHFFQKTDNEFRVALPFLESLVTEIVAYLFPAETTAQQAADNPEPETVAAQ